MNSHELQQKIRMGDRDAFRTLYNACGPSVYQRAHDSLGDEDATRSVVKQVFLNLHHEIQTSQTPLDVDARLDALTRDEIRTARLLRGDFSAASGVDSSASTSTDSAAAFSAAASTAAAAQPVYDAPKQPAASFEPVSDIPPLERTHAYMDAESQSRAGKRKGKPDGAPEHDHERHERGNAVITVLIVIFLLMFVWVLAGILMDFSIIPRIDLGYEWFNNTIFPLFKL